MFTRRFTAFLAATTLSLLGAPPALAATTPDGTSPHTVASAAAQRPAAAPAGADTITFDEFPEGTAISEQYQDRGVLFDGDEPFIASDDSNPTSPVLSGSPRFEGSVRAQFVTPFGAVRTVAAFSVDVGYINTPGAVSVTTFDKGGAVLDTQTIMDLGVVPITVETPGIAAFEVAGTGEEDNGFALDNLSFAAPQAIGYAALGDSYASGEGNPPFDVGTTSGKDTCHRSASAWPRLLDAADPTISSVRLLACSGAKVAAITSATFKTEKAQVKQLAAVKSRVGLITVTIGGNDIGFSDILTACYLDTGGPICVRRLEKAKKYIAKTLPGKLAEAYKAIRRNSAGGTRIVAVGYPNLMNTNSLNAQLHCFWVSPASWNRLVDLGTQLDDAVAAAASRAHIGYASVLGALDGHELCTGDSWIYAIGPFGGQLRGHPLLAGQQAIAADIRAYLHALG